MVVAAAAAADGDKGVPSAEVVDAAAVSSPAKRALCSRRMASERVSAATEAATAL